MVLVELPVAFKDLTQMMEIFEKKDSEIGEYIVDVQGDYLILEPPFHKVSSEIEG